MVLPILGANTESAAYDISNSIRMDDGDNPKLSRSISSSGSARNATLSVWIKRGNFGSRQQIYSNKTASASFSGMNMYFDGSTDRLYIDHHDGSSNISLYTNQVFRDPSAWYHIVHAIDTTTGTATNRLRLYINGEEVTDFATDQNPSQNADLALTNSTGDQSIGDDPRDSSDLFDGYMAEYNFVDGTTLDPTYFGETNSNGVWVPKEPDVSSYGTNGFFLEFKQTGTSANSSGMGADTSGNDNHFSVTGLTAAEITTDTPTNNFCTWNPLFTNQRGTFQYGNTYFTTSVQGSVPYGQNAFGNIAVNKGKWYCEFRINAVGSGGTLAVGWNERAEDGSYINGHNNLGSSGNTWYGSTNGEIRVGSSSGTNTTTYTTGDIIGAAIDLDNNKIHYHKNGSYQRSSDPANNTGGDSLSSSYNNYWTPWMSKDDTSNNATVTLNTGAPNFTISSAQSDDDGHGIFEYDVPTGYFALCTKNLAEYG